MLVHATRFTTNYRAKRESERNWERDRQIFTSSLVCAALWELPFIMLAAWTPSQCKHYRTEIWNAPPVWRRSANLFISCGFRSTLRQQRRSPFCWHATKANWIAEFIQQLTDDPDKLVKHKHSGLKTIFWHVRTNFASSYAVLCFKSHLWQTALILESTVLWCVSVWIFSDSVWWGVGVCVQVSLVAKVWSNTWQNWAGVYNRLLEQSWRWDEMCACACECVHVSEWPFVLAGPGLEAISKRNSLDFDCRPPLPMWIVFIVLRVMQTPTPPFSTSLQSKPVIPTQFEQFSYRCIYTNLTPSECSVLACEEGKKKHGKKTNE